VTHELLIGPVSALSILNMALRPAYGYTALPDVPLCSHSFSPSPTRFSDPLMRYVEQGFYPPFDEKTQSGLKLRLPVASRFSPSNYPTTHYSDFEQRAALLPRR